VYRFAPILASPRSTLNLTPIDAVHKIQSRHTRKEHLNHIGTRIGHCVYFFLTAPTQDHFYAAIQALDKPNFLASSFRDQGQKLPSIAPLQSLSWLIQKGGVH
jgi:hypothetical protein